MSKMKRLASKKSYSWWWDSHISPKNSKWLDENLEEMDTLVKKMLRLIDEEGDSFAKKAEMYYQKRPELISLVEDFYRMYRALGERYDNVTGELRRSMPVKKGSPGSGVGSLPPIRSPDHTPERKNLKAKASPRAAGFDVFLGSGGSSDISRKGSGSSSSSSSDSESDSDATKDGSFHFDVEDQQHRISELESEVEELMQRLGECEGSVNGSHDHDGNGNQEDLHSRLLELESELTDTTGRLKVSEEEIKRLQQELEAKIQAQEDGSSVIQGLSLRVSDLETELTSANARLQTSEEEVKKLRHDLEMKGLTDDAEREQISDLERKITVLEMEIIRHQREIEESKSVHASAVDQLKNDILERDVIIEGLSIECAAISEELNQGRLQLEGEIVDRNHTIEELKAVHAASVDQLRRERDVAIEGLKVECAAISEKHQQEKLQLEDEIANRDRTIEQLRDDLRKFSQEKSALESRLSEVEQEVAELKEETILLNKKFLLDKQQLESQMISLSESHSSLTLKLELLEGVKRQLEAEKEEAHAATAQQVSDLNRNMDELKTRLDVLISEKEEFSARVSVLLLEIKSKDDHISDTDAHLHQLHMEHMNLIKEAQEANKASDDLRVRVATLEEEVERQRIVISDSAEGKREAIRQLCFSLEHYRLGYQELRQALIGHRRTQAQTVLAS